MDLKTAFCSKVISIILASFGRILFKFQNLFIHIFISLEVSWNLTNRFHVAVRLFSNRWRPLWSITEQTHDNVEFICFIQWSEKKIDRYTSDTYLPLTAWLFEDLFRHFLSSRRYFSSLLRLFFFILIAYSFFEKFFNVFSCSNQNNGENILQNGECLIAMKHDGSCCEDFL